MYMSVFSFYGIRDCVLAPVHRFHDEVLSFRKPDSWHSGEIKTFGSDGNLVLVIVSLMLL